MKTTLLTAIIASIGLVSYADTLDSRRTVDSNTDLISDDYVGSSYSSGTAATGGAIYNSSTIGTISGDFTNNKAYTTAASKYAQGGAIYNFTSATITLITGDFTGNSVSTTYSSNNIAGGAIFNRAGTITDITGSFTGNSVVGVYASDKIIVGGAIGNYGDSGASKDAYIGLLAYKENLTISCNYSAITTSGSTSYASSGIYNYVAGTNADAIIGLKALDGYKIIINDTITGASSYVDNQILEVNNIALADYGATSYSTVEINNAVSNQTINVYNGTLKLGSYAGNEYVNDNYTTSSSIANLTNVKLNVGCASGGDTQLTLVAGSTVILSSSTIVFDANSALSIDISALDSYIIDDLNLITIDSSSLVTSTDLTTINLVNANNNILSSAEVDETLIYDGYEWIVTFGSDSITLSTVAVPEPSTYAMIFGALALGLAVYRRRK